MQKGIGNGGTDLAEIAGTENALVNRKADRQMQDIDVVHMISGDLWAGAEVQVFHTLSQFKAQNRFSFATILFSEGLLYKKLAEANVPTVVIDESKNNPLSMLIVLTKLVAHLRPKILHIHAYKEHILGQISVTLNHGGTSIFRTFHGMSEVPKGLSPIKQLKSTAIHRLEKLFLNHPAVNLIAVSKDLESFLKRSYPRATVTQIYNSIPIHRKTQASRKQIRNEYGVKDGMFWIGNVARLTEPKNLALLINAGTQLQLSGMDFRISIWGEGPLKEELQKQIDANGLQSSIILEGFEDNIFPVLQSVDLFVLCSLHEGLPMSLLEAMALGVPVVCTNVGGIKEVITHNETGLLIPSNDVPALVDAIKTMRAETDLGERLAEHAKTRVHNDFNIKKNNQKLIELYQSRLGG